MLATFTKPPEIRNPTSEIGVKTMASSITTDIWKGGGEPPGSGDFGGGPGRGASRRASLTGLMVLLAAVVMFFAALSRFRECGEFSLVPSPRRNDGERGQG